MKYKSIATPKPVAGQGGFPKPKVVPNQSMSLAEILQRFTRGEPLNIGRGTPTYYEAGEDDLEKISTLDLVERQEFIDKQKAVRATYDKQEKRRARILKEQFEERAKAEIKAEMEAKKQQKGDKPENAK